MRSILFTLAVFSAATLTAFAEDRTVAPGKVRWHPSFEEAVRAAGKSGRPVLLFQLLGRLDQEFC